MWLSDLLRSKLKKFLTVFELILMIFNFSFSELSHLMLINRGSQSFGKLQRLDVVELSGFKLIFIFRVAVVGILVVLFIVMMKFPPPRKDLGRLILSVGVAVPVIMLLGLLPVHYLLPDVHALFKF